jgi:mono/diheme cytochrome c family protein
MISHSNSRLVLIAMSGLAAMAFPTPAVSAETSSNAPVTFNRDIVPILQKSCQSCHRPNSIAPMSFVTYEETRPWAKAMKSRTAIRNRQGTMPPWYIEKDIGIQRYKNDVSLSEDEIAKIREWADNGAPRGNPSDAPPPLAFSDGKSWQIGKPDLIVVTPPVHMRAVSSDWWGDAGFADTGLTEDRYVSAVEIKEVSDSQTNGAPGTIGGLFVFHHAIMAVTGPNGGANFGSWPIHEVGRNADVFDLDAGKLLKAGSRVGFPNVHLHANGTDTAVHLEVGFRFHPKGYQPKMQERILTIGTGDLDIRPMESNQKVESFFTLQQPTKITVYEPHMHAAGVRMCLDAIWGAKTETLSCSGYDHNWVRAYTYADDTAPLLPRGTILRVTGTFDNTPANKNVVDPRNWSGLGHRSIDNMAILILQAVSLSEDRFQEEVSSRRQALNLSDGQSTVGCPLCSFAKLPASRTASVATPQR